MDLAGDGTGTLIAAVSAGVVSGRLSSMGAAVTAIGVLGAILLWGIFVLVIWFTRKTYLDRTYRARVCKAFAVCSMFLGCVGLFAALLTMPITQYRQNKYFERTRIYQQDEVSAKLGKDWGKRFRVLGEEIFTPKD